jgi:hypothetical protein
MVILGPIDQLGCLSACAGVTAANSAIEKPEGAARAGQEELLEDRGGAYGAGGRSLPGPPGARRDALEQGAVLAVHGQDQRAAAPRRVQDERSAGDHALLVGQGQCRAGVERRHRGAQTGGADDAVEHREGHAGRGRVGGRARDELLHAGFAGEHKELGRPRGRVGRGRRVAEAHVVHAVMRRLFQQQLAVRAGRQADQFAPLYGGQHIQRLSPD